MTKAEALAKAAAKFDRLYTDSIRKLTSDLCAAGRDDDEIADLVAEAIERYDECFEKYMAEVGNAIDTHFSTPPITH